MMTLDFVLRIVAASILGGIIGFEREYRSKEAGFRTHFLVALGSALFMILSQYGFDSVLVGANVSLDPSRIASQVVTGIGFIGAGTIIFHKHIIRGLTTAAGVWVTAAIGMACGSGMYAIASLTTVLVLLCLEAFSVILFGFEWRHVSVSVSMDECSKVGELIDELRTANYEVVKFHLSERVAGSNGKYVANLEIRTRRFKYKEKLLEVIGKTDGVDLNKME